MTDVVLEQLLKDWTIATADLKYGVQRVFHDVFALAAEEKTHLIYDADYYEGMPCLVNTVGGMLTTGGGMGVPMANFADVVNLFDQINARFYNAGINTEFRKVNPVVAEILLKNFSELKEAPDPDVNTLPYREPSDTEMAEAMVNLFTSEPMPLNQWEFDGVGPQIADIDNDFVVMKIKPSNG